MLCTVSHSVGSFKEETIKNNYMKKRVKYVIILNLHTDRQTDTDRQIHTRRHTQTQTNTDTHTDTHIHRHTHTDTHRYYIRESDVKLL